MSIDTNISIAYITVIVDTKINKYLSIEIILYKENIFHEKLQKTYALPL